MVVLTYHFSQRRERHGLLMTRSKQALKPSRSAWPHGASHCQGRPDGSNARTRWRWKETGVSFSGLQAE